MAHHGEDPLDDQSKKYMDDDEGEIEFRVGSESGKVILDFGKPVAWVHMEPQRAAGLASMLLKWARIEGRKDGVTISIDFNAT